MRAGDLAGLLRFNAAVIRPMTCAALPSRRSRAFALRHRGAEACVKPVPM